MLAGSRVKTDMPGAQPCLAYKIAAARKIRDTTASAPALGPAVKRTMSMLCYGRAPAVRQPARYPVRASTE